jgi:hypothetical protein
LQIAGTVTLPFDVVKTHKQIELGDMDFAVKGKRKSASGYIFKIMRQACSTACKG